MADLADAYADGRHRLVQLLEGLDRDAAGVRLPACPSWSLLDLVAHLAGVAADAAGGGYFLGAADAWTDARLAEQRDAWTAAHIGTRRGMDLSALVDEWVQRAAVLEPVLAGSAPAPAGSPEWVLSGAVGDLAVHLLDARGALGTPGTGPLR